MIDNLKKLAEQRNLPWLEKGIIFAHTAGSHMYGTATPTSDRDIRGYYIPPLSYWIGIDSIDGDSIVTEVDGVDWHLWDFRKWVNLTLKNNPNVLETLWVPKNCVVKENASCHTAIIRIMGNPITEQVKTTFIGFALSQIKKLKTKAANKAGRQDLIAKYGYDTKFLAHAVRIINQLSDILIDGKVTYPLRYADDLLYIRNGSIKDLDQYLETLEKGIKSLESIEIVPTQDNDEIRKLLYWYGFYAAKELHANE